MKRKNLLFLLNLMLLLNAPSMMAADYTESSKADLSGETIYTLLERSLDTPQTWKYALQTTGSSMSDQWMMPSFDDSGWSEGLGQFGTPWQGDYANKNTTFDEPGGDLYLRKTITFSGISEDVINNLYIYTRYDDDILVFINGVFAVYAKVWIGEFSYFSISDEAKNAINPNGDNLIAILNSNAAGGQGVDMGLVTTHNPNSSAESSDCNVTSFSINGRNANIVDTSISLQLMLGTDLTSLTPVVEVSTGADYIPKGAQDFTNPVEYTITAEDGTSKKYTVAVTTALLETSTADLSTASIYKILDASINVPQEWAYVHQASSASIADNWMNPGFDDASWSRGNGQFATAYQGGFTNRGTTIPEGNNNLYVRKIFSLENASNDAVSNIYLYVKADDDALVYINGVIAAYIKERDFAYYAVYQAAKEAIDPNGENLIAVLCSNGGGGQGLDVGIVTTSEYFPADDSDCDIVSLSINGNMGAISGTNIVVPLPAGTDVTSLTADIVLAPGATYSPPGAQDFSDAVTYTVTAKNGTSQKIYTVTVSFSFPETSTVDLSQHATLYPVLEASKDEAQEWKYNLLTGGAVLSGSWMAKDYDDSAWPSGDGQFATQYQGSFTNKGTVIATEGENNLYLRKSISMETATQDAIDNLYLYVQADDDALIYLNGVFAAYIKERSFAYYPIADAAKAAIKINEPLVIAVLNANKTGGQGIDVGIVSTQYYKSGLGTGNKITSFKLNGVEGTIAEPNITVRLVETTDITSLTPEIKVSAYATYTPQGAQDFSNPVIYTVTAENGDEKEYTVTVQLYEEKPNPVSAVNLTGDISTILSYNHDQKIFWHYALSIPDEDRKEWYKNGYDYSDWLVDEGCFATEFVCQNRGVTLPGDTYLYARRSFVLKDDLGNMASENVVDNMYLKMTFDDDALVYINGKYACYGKGWQSGGVGYYPITEEAKNSMKESLQGDGINYIAILCTNDEGGGGQHLDVGIVTNVQFTADKQPTELPDYWVKGKGPLFTSWGDAISQQDIDQENILPEYPRPQLERTDWMNLNGVWDVRKGVLGQAEYPDTDVTFKVLVPFPVGSALSGLMKYSEDYENIWYRRTFDLPAEWSGKKVLINFGAVNWEAEVFINGQNVGLHQGGYEAFSFDITDALQAGENEVTVRVWNPSKDGGIPVGKQRQNPSGIFYTPAMGIWQTVWLEPVAQQYITDLTLASDIDNDQMKITVDATQSGLSVTGSVKDNGQVVATVSGTTGTEIAVAIADAKHWSPDSPFLYDIELSIDGGDAVRSYYGLRKIEVHTPESGWKRPHLNGEEIFWLGFLDQGYWPDGIYTAPTDEALKWEIQKTKDMGFNTLRKHIKVEPARWYYWADKLGVMVMQDMPNAFNDEEDGYPMDKVNFERELTGVLNTIKNYPSVVQFTLFNEGWGQFDTERLSALVQNMDKDHIFTGASGWIDYGTGDISDNHSYNNGGLWSEADTERINICGEYGGYGLYITGHVWGEDANIYGGLADGNELTEAYLGKAAYMQQLYTERGLSGAIYTQLTDVEGELNGFITYDRAVVKVDASKIKTANEEVLEFVASNTGTGVREDIENQNIRIYTKDQILIVNADTEIQAVEIYSPMGETILKLNNQGAYSINLTVPQGVLIVKVTTDDKQTVRKVIIK